MADRPATKIGTAMRWMVLACACAVAVAPLPVARAAPPAFGEGVAAGDVLQDRAVLWTRAPAPGPVTLLLGTSADLRRGRTEQAVAHPGDGLAVQVEVNRLAAGTRYTYRFRQGGVQSPLGTFVTPPPPGSAASVTVAWSADTGEEFRPFRIFDALARLQPDLFLFLGDTVYADVGERAVTLAQYRAKYRANRADPHLQAALARTAVWATWDDHEVANNFDASHPRLDVGRRAFLEAWPVRPSREEPGRLYRRVRWGALLEVFLLDTRQYRSPARHPDGPGKTMLGARQKRWLLEGLAASTAPVKVVASSVPLRYHGRDSWEGYAHERDEILAFLRARDVRGVVVLSGDVHYPALLRHPEGVLEGIAGPLAAFPNPDPPAAGRPATLWWGFARFNFGVVRVAPGWLTLEWYDHRGDLLYRFRTALPSRQ
ncbi:MAG: alkaline phosphatase D family protein [Armatimonadota bacterium]|nr:alkaline phosphatase D family protein [Armatimonadota bacterium]